MREDVEERYPGEARGLALFLEGIRPATERRLGPDSMLAHAIRRALGTRSLTRLRQARRLFNHLPRELRHRLIADALADRPPSSDCGAGYRPCTCIDGMPAKVRVHPATARTGTPSVSAGPHATPALEDAVPHPPHRP